jgi:hypothetical protein
VGDQMRDGVVTEDIGLKPGRRVRTVWRGVLAEGGCAGEGAAPIWGGASYLRGLLISGLSHICKFFVPRVPGASYPEALSQGGDRSILAQVLAQDGSISQGSEHRLHWGGPIGRGILSKPPR